MRQVTSNVYTLDELDEKAKEKAMCVINDMLWDNLNDYNDELEARLKDLLRDKGYDGKMEFHWEWNGSTVFANFSVETTCTDWISLHRDRLDWKANTIFDKFAAEHDIEIRIKKSHNIFVEIDELSDEEMDDWVYLNRTIHDVVNKDAREITQRMCEIVDCHYENIVSDEAAISYAELNKLEFYNDGTIYDGSSYEKEAKA